MNRPKPEEAKLETHRFEVNWPNTIGLGLLHALGIYALIRGDEASLPLWTWGAFVGHLGGLGTTAGAHRLWAHRSYQATLPFKIILLFCFTLAGQRNVYTWVRDHRIHHKYTDTDADPHNARRGFFFSHVGWLLLKRHPEVIEKGRTIDMSDIENDPVLAFYNRHYVPLMLLGVVLPALVPPLLWGEDWIISILGICFLRYVLLFNLIWLVNSAAHKWGNKPFNADYLAVENWFVSFVGLGEGWHNYHHAFPFDYRAQELGPSLSTTTKVIDLAAHLGMVYGKKQASKELVHNVASKHGDGSWYQAQDLKTRPCTAATE